ncbi:MAG TPA: 4a-hydroxytetrahydrobiopterin dehydratase [Candidatus Limnocylindria bacterium]|nr:4a-hydroxytetrahydrobiopterin dehydratase [Candidatus Limnocylindria bacterium]
MPAAAEINRQPDVFIHWRDVRLSTWTHAAGGLTRRDIRLAQAIEDVAAARSTQRR